MGAFLTSFGSAVPLPANAWSPFSPLRVLLSALPAATAPLPCAWQSLKIYETQNSSIVALRIIVYNYNMNEIQKKIEDFVKVNDFKGCVKFDEPMAPRTTFKIGGCGFACVLIETRILKAVWDKHGTCFFPTRELGEDVAFCVKARECGFEIYAEPTVRLGHIGHITIYPEYSETYASSIQNFNEVMNNGNA